MAIEDIVAAMPPATWYEVPGTSISAVFPAQAGHPAYGTTGPAAVIRDWCGGAFDTTNNRFIIHGGGHASYGGNEVYEFWLSDLTWRRVTEPSSYIDDPAKSDPLYVLTADGTPISVHSYDNLAYLPALGKMFRFSGAEWEHGNSNDPHAYLFDIASRTWEQKAAATGGLTVESATAYDASRNCVWVLQRNRMLKYDITLDTWTEVETGYTSQGDQMTMGYDPVGDQLVIAGANGSNIVAKFDCVNAGGLVPVTVTGTMVPTVRAGLAYDTSRALFTMWTGDREVWTLDPATWVGAQVNATGGDAPVDPGLSVGVYSKWQYVPDHDIFIGYNNDTGNVWLYKAGTAGSGPAPGWGDPTRRVKLTIPAAALTAAGATGTHTGVPVLIQRTNLPNEMFDPSGASNAQVNAGDVRISLDAQGASRLPLDKVQFTHDSATGAGDGKCALWTRLPTVSDASDTDLYVWYNSATTQVQPLESEPYGRDAVWAGYIGVWHINSNTGAVDATGQGNDLAISGAQNVGAGPFASDPRSVNVDFNATALTPLLALDQDYTFSVIYQRPGAISYPRDQYVLYGAGATSTTKAVAAQGAGAQETDVYVYDESGVAQKVHDNSWFIEDQWLWNSIVTARGSGEQSFYRNADQQNSITATRRVGTGALQLFSCDVAIWYAEAFIREGLSTPARVKLEYLNQTSPASFFTTSIPATPSKYVSVAIAWSISAAPTQSASRAIAWAIESETFLAAKAIAWSIQALASKAIAWAIKRKSARAIAWAIDSEHKLLSHAIAWEIQETAGPTNQTLTQAIAWRIGVRWFKVTR